MRPPLPLPTEDSADGVFARLLAAALGTAFQAADGTALAADLLALGGALADARQARRDLADEAYVDTAFDLLAEWERAYGLPVEPERSLGDRRTRLLAKVRAARAGTPEQMLAALRTIDPTATLVETTPGGVVQEPDTDYPSQSRGVWQFVVIVAAATFDDNTKVAALNAIVEQMKPAHSRGSVALSQGFFFGISRMGYDTL